MPSLKHPDAPSIDGKGGGVSESQILVTVASEEAAAQSVSL
jgi:hypothetical protein